jgi:AcrR family transcriptional regulator
LPHYVSRDDYFAAAVGILSEVGFRGLKMTALHQRLGVTSGSFYNYFRNWPDFVQQFLAHWLDRTDQIAQEAARPNEAVNRLELLRGLSKTVPHDAEAAIRIWAAMDPAVGEVQRAVDERRVDLIAQAVAQVRGHEHDAHRLAELCLAGVVGLQMLRRPVDLDEMDWQLAQFITLVLHTAGDRP